MDEASIHDPRRYVLHKATKFWVWVVSYQTYKSLNGINAARLDKSAMERKMRLAIYGSGRSDAASILTTYEHGGKPKSRRSTAIFICIARGTPLPSTTNS